MPTYDFQCCGNRVTVTASMSEMKTPVCANCVKPMQRIYDFAAIRFRGSGFYSNDKKETNE